MDVVGVLVMEWHAKREKGGVFVSRCMGEGAKGTAFLSWAKRMVFHVVRPKDRLCAFGFPLLRK